jgi:ankyrin repeat protein
MQIHYHAAQGNIDAVKYDLHHRSDVSQHLDMSPYETMTPLMFAARSPFADIDMLQFLVNEGANVNVKSLDTSHTPLGLAAKSGNIEKVKFLLAVGADPNFQDSERYSSLIHAALTQSHKNRKQLFKILLNAGANPNVVTDYGESALNIVSRFADFECIKILIQAGVDPAPLQWTPLMEAVVFDTFEQVESQLSIADDLTTIDRWWRSAFGLSVAMGDVRKAKLLVENGCILSDDDIYWAVRNDNTNMLRWLLYIDAYPNAMDDYGLLIEASRYGATQCIKLLLDMGAKVETRRYVGDTAISSAQNSEIVRLLANAGEDINFINTEGYSILRSATEDANLSMVRDLLKIGADPNVSHLGETALWTAVKNDYYQIVKVLLDNGADPNFSTIDEWYPLQSAKTSEIVELLLNSGANPLKQDSLGRFASEYHDDSAIISILKRAERKRNRKK